MQKNNAYLGVIVARGGSKRLPGKNIKLLGSKPLIGYSIEASLASKRLTKVIVSTDDPKIANECSNFGLPVPFLRPANLAEDNSSVIEVLLHALNTIEQDSNFRFDALVLLQATSPFRTAEHIDSAIEKFEKSNADTLTSVSIAMQHPYWAWKELERDYLEPAFSLDQMSKQRNDLPAMFFENGAIFIVRTSLIRQLKMYGKKITYLRIEGDAAIDIDTPDDFIWAEMALKRLKLDKP